MIDLDALERAAQAASPGPWEWIGTNALFAGSEDILKAGDDGRPWGMHSALIEHHWDEKVAQANRDHIAASNPQTVLALVKVCRAAQAWCRIEHPGMVYKPLLDALREAGL